MCYNFFSQECQEIEEMRHVICQQQAAYVSPVLLLIDVSGSMKERTDAHLRFAHTLAQSAEQVEVFTFGTRLTRITRALKLKRQDQALDMFDIFWQAWITRMATTALPSTTPMPAPVSVGPAPGGGGLVPWRAAPGRYGGRRRR